jgi:catechol 2,3-dioxygenase-like lactoylglutathione lyase family enzyme
MTTNPTTDPGLPRMRQVVLDTTDARGLAEFYRELLGLSYRPGDEPPAPGQDDERGRDWLVLRGAGGGDPTSIAFQQVAHLPRVTWPEGPHPQMLHLDLTVEDAETLVRQRDRATALGAEILWDRFDDPDEPLYVFADPAGHPFCIFVG